MAFTAKTLNPNLTVTLTQGRIMVPTGPEAWNSEMPGKLYKTHFFSRNFGSHSGGKVSISGKQKSR